MARVDLTPQDIVLAGITPVLAAASAEGHAAPCGLENFLLVRNDGAAPITVTVPSAMKVKGLDVSDLAVSIPAGGEKMIGPLYPGLFSQAGGKAYVDLSDITSVSLGVFRIS